MRIDHGIQDATISRAGEDFAAGVKLETIAAGSIHGVSVVLDGTSELGAVINAQLLDESLGILAVTPDHVVNSVDLTGLPVYMAFDTPQTITTDLDQHIVIASIVDSNDVVIAASGEAATGSALLYDPGALSWEFLLQF